MIKYKATSALNYLSENSYKGDGAPGMVMGIASDARGDTNTYEDTKKLDEVAFLAPAVWSAARVATPWLLKQGWKIIKGSGKFAWKNPKTAVVVGGGVAYKDELAAVAEYLSGIGEAIEPVLKYAKQYALPVMAVFALMYGGKKIHDMLNDNDPEAEPDEETPILGRGEDGELADIRKLSGLDEAKRKPRPDIDDDDDEEDEEKAEDPDADKVQHILMQLRKAQDVDGDHPIKFLDGTKVKLPLEDITLFMNKYMDMKPLDREKMQQVAIISKEQFDKILTFFQPKHGQRQKSIYEK
jgi:hypothetical protein